MSGYMKTLENAIQAGKPVLLQNILETLEPALNPILKKSIVIQQGQMVLKMMDKYIPYNDKFRFFITTKLPNPHYSPEVKGYFRIIIYRGTEIKKLKRLLNFRYRRKRLSLIFR